MVLARLAGGVPSVDGPARLPCSVKVASRSISDSDMVFTRVGREGMFLRFLEFEEGGICILIEIHPDPRFGGCFRSARNSLCGFIRDNTYMPLQKLGRNVEGSPGDRFQNCLDCIYRETGSMS